DAQPGDLAGRLVGLRGHVAFLRPDQDEEAAADLPDDTPLDANLGAGDPLDHQLHARRLRTTAASSAGSGAPTTRATPQYRTAPPRITATTRSAPGKPRASSRPSDRRAPSSAIPMTAAAAAIRARETRISRPCSRPSRRRR